MVFLKITNLWTNTFILVAVKNMVKRKLLQYLRNIPKGYNHNYRKRKLCYQIDCKFQKIIGNYCFYLSMYSSRFYKVEFICVN